MPAIAEAKGLPDEESRVEKAVKRVIDSAEVFRELGVGRGEESGMASSAPSRIDKCVSMKGVSAGNPIVMKIQTGEDVTRLY